MRQSLLRMAGWVGKRKLVPRQTSFKSVAYLMLVPVAGILLFFLWNFLHGSIEPIAVLQSAIPRKQKPAAARRVMASLLGALPDGMCFIDPKTTGNSVAGPLAHSMRVKTASRSVFLDDVQSEVEIRRQLASLTHAAEEHGVAVGIGHMYPSTIRVLSEEAPALRARGVRFVRASTVVD